MSTYPCPKGHDSTESDFCSDCGAKILGAPKPANPISSAPVLTASSSLACPDCTAPHELDSGDFCEICGYNFITNAHGEVAIAPSTSTPPPSASASPPSISSATLTWEALITLDPALRLADSPPPPDLPAIAIPLDKTTHLIGRTSQVRAIYPEIALDFDDAVSHRHAVLTFQPDRSLSLRDIGSSNGTQLNGADLAAMTDTPIQSGDEITVGHWTRITVRQLTAKVEGLIANEKIL